MSAILRFISDSSCRIMPPKNLPHHSPAARTAPSVGAPLYRSGAVARMVRMPVATLRIWERRYQISAPALTLSGQRLYSAADVRRLGLLKQLTDLGHAIGSLAPLDWPQLQAVANTHASAVAGQRAPAPAPAAPWRVAVVGTALAKRLQHPGVRRAIGRSMDVVGVYASVQQAAAAQKATAIDALVVHDARPDGQVRPRSLRDVPMALLYRFAAEPVCEQLAADHVALLREPQGDTALGQWLRGLSLSPAMKPVATPAAAPQSVRPRRWNDAQLVDFAGLSSTIACECPHHVAELLMQLSHFEAYSAACANSSDADALLHGFLRDVAGTSRAHFEDALERVAVHEGLLVPS
jgi:MerR family transcriptional regulator, light-induced transcriptional regulator